MGFDLKTHKMNKKGQVIRTQPYRLYIDKGVRKFERPPGSGQFFAEDGSPIASTKKEESVKVEVKAEVKAETKKASPLPAQKKDDIASLKADLLGED